MISKKTREIVYNKYNGHCAYCGCEIEMKDMQVDHIVPKYRNNEMWHKGKIGTDEISNLLLVKTLKERRTEYERN